MNIYDIIDHSNIADKEKMKYRYDKYRQYCQMPLIFNSDNIDERKLPVKHKIFLDNIYEIISRGYNYIVIVSNKNMYVPYYISLLIDKYFKEVFIDRGELTKNILFIDVPILLRDFKSDIEDERILIHDDNILRDSLYTCPFIFWEDFHLMKSDYDKVTMRDIVKIRSRYNVGNMYIISKESFYKESLSLVEPYIRQCVTVDCSKEEVNLIDIKGGE